MLAHTSLNSGTPLDPLPTSGTFHTSHRCTDSCGSCMLRRSHVQAELMHHYGNPLALTTLLPSADSSSSASTGSPHTTDTLWAKQLGLDPPAVRDTCNTTMTACTLPQFATKTHRIFEAALMSSE